MFLIIIKDHRESVSVNYSVGDVADLHCKVFCSTYTVCFIL